MCAHIFPFQLVDLADPEEGANAVGIANLTRPNAVITADMRQYNECHRSCFVFFLFFSFYIPTLIAPSLIFVSRAMRAQG